MFMFSVRLYEKKRKRKENMAQGGTGTRYRKIRTFLMVRLKIYCRDTLGNKNKRKYRNQKEILVYSLKVNNFPSDIG